MSYTNQQTTWLQRQGSIAGALIINGAIIAGLLLTKHVALPTPNDGPITYIDMTEKEPPPEDIFAEQEIAKIPPVALPQPPFDIPVHNDFAETAPIDVPTGPIILAGTADGAGDVFVPPPVEPAPRDPLVIAEPIFIGAARDPKYVSRFQPIYPGTLLRQEVEGKVRLTFLIGADGRVKSVNILSASHPRFAKATEKQALSKWRFIPATRDGVAIEEWQTITVSFNIN